MGGAGKSIRILGLELAGAKNDKTALAVLEYFPAEAKTYLLHLYEGLGSRGDRTADDVLLSVLRESRGLRSILCVNVPLQFPPCTLCDLKACRDSGECRSRAALWSTKFKGGNFTPYTQRPVEVWLKREIIEKLDLRLNVDETLGGARAPLTARMIHLAKLLDGFEIIECLPKLSTLLLGRGKKVPKRILEDVRALGKGVRARADLIAHLAPTLGLFLGSGDQTRAARSLAAFDALLCGITGVFYARGRCVAPPKGFPVQSGWVQYPQC